MVDEMRKTYQPITFEREDYCIHCNTERSLMLYDYFGNKINFPNLLDRGDSSVFNPDTNSRQYMFMKCDHCGKEFFIDWSQGPIPRPMFFRFFKSFMKDYRSTKKY